jgi:hypothetical protein
MHNTNVLSCFEVIHIMSIPSVAPAMHYLLLLLLLLCVPLTICAR